jgi:hypothetical protein
VNLQAQWFIEVAHLTRKCDKQTSMLTLQSNE